MRRWTGVAAGIVLLALAACARQETGARVAAPQPCDLEGVANCRSVGSDLVFAGQPTPDALRELAGRGYHTILSTRGEGELDWDEKALADSLGMKFVTIPMGYPIESIRDEWVEQFDRLMSGAERPMLAHCSSGNRVAGLWAVWLAERKGVPAAEAIELGTEAGMTRLRPVVEKRLAADAK